MIVLIYGISIYFGFFSQPANFLLPTHIEILDNWFLIGKIAKTIDVCFL